MDQANSAIIDRCKSNNLRNLAFSLLLSSILIATLGKYYERVLVTQAISFV